MEPSEREAPQGEPMQGHQEDVIDLAATASEPAATAAPADATPLEPAEPGKYWCEQEGGAGRHNVLGNIVEGENDLSWLTTDEEKLALAAYVRAGVLEKMDEAQANKDAQG